MRSDPFRFTLFIGLLLGFLQTMATLLVFAAGLHRSAADLEAGHRFENIASFFVIITCLTLGLRAARKARHTAGQTFNFGVGARLALGCSAAGGLFTAAGQWTYVTWINPAYSNHLRELLVAGAALSPEQVEAAQAQLDFATSAVFRALAHGITTLFFSLLIGFAFAFLFRDRPTSAVA